MNRYRSFITCAFCICMLVFTCRTAWAQTCFTSYSLSSSGSPCSTTATIIMSGSQNGISYQLSGSGGNIGSPVTGTGSAITWSNITIPNGNSEILVTASETGSSCSPTIVANNEVILTPAANGTISAPNGTLICGGIPVTLTIIPTVADPYSYQWYNNGSAITNAITPTLTATTPGTYTATISNSCGSTTLSGVTVTAIGTLSAISGNNSIAANTTTSTYTASAANASNYTWTISPASAGTISGTGTTGTVTWNTTFGGIATISVAVIGCSGAGSSNNFAVAYNAINYDYNYIQETDLRVANITSTTAMTGLPIGQADVTYTYFDGLGRPVQKVSQGASPASNDIIEPIAYDQLGREAFKYMPYTTASGTAGTYRNNALTSSTGYTGSGQYQFYQATNPNYVNTTAPSSQTSFEASPLSRVTEQGFNGLTWQVGGGHTVRPNYLFNNNTTWTSNAATSMQVALYTATINSDGSRTLSRASSNAATYNTNQLSVTVTEDENGTPALGRAGTTEEYKDILGHVVLKRVYNNNSGTMQVLSTYYVYDAYNLLAFVLPPLSNADISGTAISQTTLNNYCYQYQYDQRKRLIAKKLPGKGWEYTVYNAADQVVATQDSVQRISNQWTFTKYDPLSREAYTGIWNNSNTAISRASLQDTINKRSGPLFETRATGQGYTNICWPTTFLFSLKVSYYDDYTAPGNPYTPWVSGTLTTPTGLPTITLTKVLNADGTRPTLWSVNYYDSLGRLVQTTKQHYLGGAVNYSTSNFNVITNTYNFANEVTASTTFHLTAANTSAVTLTDGKNYFYDNEGRKTQTWEAITVGTNPSPNGILLSQTNYNEIGQVLAKHLYSTNSGTSFLQNTGFTYNERGWLSQLNNPAVAPTTTQLFAEQLNYNTTQYGATPQYNGNIAEQAYNAGISGSQHVTYSYDNLNRLLAGTGSDGFSETGISYDQMGNLLSLTRAGTGNGTLTYTYTNGNQLSSIGGFKAGSYVYDGNGNVTTDGPRAATIGYNMLNLPQTVTATTPAVNIAYTYDADGNKLRKVSGTTTVTTTDYIDGIQYTNGAIAFLQTEEGRAINTGGTSYNYEFTLTDHLGNNRVTFDIVNGKVGEDDYYPFGLNVHRELNAGNNYLYNKKELQNETQEYDYGARFYDPVIARWTVVDAKAEINRRWSPYNYALNNPIRFIDPDGNAPEWILGADGKTAAKYTVNADGTLTWTNATSGTQTIGNALAASGAIDDLNAYRDAKQEVVLNYSSENNDTEIGHTDNSYIHGTDDVVKSTVTIYGGAIDEYQQKVDGGATLSTDKGHLQTAALQLGDKVAVIAAAAGHERIHATDQQNQTEANSNKKQGTNFDLEKAPVAHEIQILQNAIIKDVLKNIPIF